MMEKSEEEDVQQIRVSLILSKTCADTSLKVPSTPIAVPATTRKKGLSAIINHLLDRKVIRDKAYDDQSDSDDDDDDDDDEDKLPSLPFDFLLNNKLLRLSVEAAARREGLSLEKPVEIYYFPARLAPESDGQSESFPDWISALSYSSNTNSNALYSGSCDGSIRIFNHTKEDGFAVCDVIKAHSGPIKCISSFGCLGKDSVTMVASGSMDQTLVSHCHEHQNSGSGSKIALHAVYSGGHTSSVNSVALTSSSSSSSSSLIMASGDWNGGLCIWKVPNLDDNDEEQQQQQQLKHKRKKKKGLKSSSAPSSDASSHVKEVSPTYYYRAHKSNISSVLFAHNNNNNNNSEKGDDASTVFTSSWDHSIKAWDVESQNEILTLNGSKVVTSMGRCHNSDVVATGHPDCSVRLWDMRTSGNGVGGVNGGDGNVFDGTLRPSHKAWIAAVEWSPNDPFVLASSSHDGTVKVWDIRSSLPLHTVRAHTKGSKSLCLAFAANTIFSGGSDCIVKKYKL